MQRLDTQSRPTLAAMYPKGFFPTATVDIPDEGAPGGVIHYAIRMGKDEDKGRYRLYFDDNRVVFPQTILASYKGIFDDHLQSQVNPTIAKRMYEDLGLDEDTSSSLPYVAARTFPKGSTPPPQSYTPRKPQVITVDQRERKTPVLVETISMEEKIGEAREQIRLQVAEKSLPVYSLPDGSGHYANIVDYTTGQVHQVGYSWKKKGPWHTVYQLRATINSATDHYDIPQPRLEFGQLTLDGLRGNPDLKLIYQRSYDEDAELMKLHTRRMLGKLDTQSREYIHGVAPISSMYKSSPNNVIPFDPRQPDWLISALKDLHWNEREEPGIPTRRRSVIADSIPAESVPSVPRPRYGRRPEPKPGEFGWRLIDLVDTGKIPTWLQTAIPTDGGRPFPALEPNPIEEGWRGLPKMPRVRRPHVEYQRESGYAATLPVMPEPTRFNNITPSVPTLQYVGIDKTPSTFGDPYARLGFI